MTYAQMKIRALTDGVQKWIDPDHDCCSGIFAFCQPQTEFVSTLFKNNLKPDKYGAACKNSIRVRLSLSSPIFALHLIIINKHHTKKYINEIITYNWIYRGEIMTDWHRIFGLIVTEHFEGTSYTVELEKDLSLKQQFLDVVIIENGEGETPSEFLDGLENMSAHNLITYKSHQESLDDWTLDEFLSYFVNYRKQVSPSMKKLLPLGDFRRYAVSTRYPRKLAGMVPFRQIGEGVYEVGWAVRRIR
ncbi:MAG: hypothetical protein DRI57_07525, partial [Deltaproteobacteria bacterium]